MLKLKSRGGSDPLNTMSPHISPSWRDPSTISKLSYSLLIDRNFHMLGVGSYQSVAVTAFLVM